MTSRWWASGALTVLFVACTGELFGQTPAVVPSQSTGRVVATVTTLEGAVHMPGVQVELLASADSTVLAKTLTDGAGQVVIPDISPGRYIVRVSRAGFIPRQSTDFEVRAGETAQVLIDIQLTFSVPSVEVRAETPSPTDSVQPVSMSDMLSGTVLESRHSKATTSRVCCRFCPASSAGPTAGCGSRAVSPRKVRCRSAAPASSILLRVTSIWICRDRASSRSRS